MVFPTIVEPFKHNVLIGYGVSPHAVPFSLHTTMQTALPLAEAVGSQLKTGGHDMLGASTRLETLYCDDGGTLKT